MPSRNAIKAFIEDGYYHVYNRGVNKNNIFLDDQDFQNFLWIMKEYLEPAHANHKYPNRIVHGLADEIKMLCYCLMPNHFHFLVKQHTLDGLTKFMKRLGTNYSAYFNHRYNRIGTLFQGKYKASLIDNDAYLIQISAYIHQNPLDLDRKIDEYEYSSYQNYLGGRKTDWLDTHEILSLFTTKNTQAETNYENFVKYPEIWNNDKLKELAIDVDQ